MPAPRNQYLTGKPKPYTFRPPGSNRFFIWLAKRLLPLILRRSVKIVEVEVNEAGLRRLRELRGTRVILTPNHAQGVEPAIVFHLSKLLNEDFNYLASKEAFEHPSPVPWLVQQLGAYSVVRGTPDRDSFRMTRRLLVEGRRWLVIFPEGEVCWQDDTVMPFQLGVAQLAFWAYDDLARQGDRPPVYFVPVAIKYVYLQDMRPEIDRSLKRLEEKLLSVLTPQPSSLYDRLRRVGEAVVSANEKEYNVRPHEGAELNERVQQMKELITARVEAALGVSPRAEQPLLERIRNLFNAFDRTIYSESEGPEYERELHQRRRQEIRMLYDDLSQVLRFVALYDGYVRETLTAERFLDVLGRLEVEILGRRKILGSRKAIMKIGEPLNLGDYFPRYKTDKRGTLQEIMTSLEDSVRKMLSELSRLTEPIEPVE